MKAVSISPGQTRMDVVDWYAYDYNNPSRFIDPSGHFCVDVNGEMICSDDDDSNGWWADTGESCRTNPFQPMCSFVYEEPSIDPPDLSGIVDEWLWDNIPSAVGWTWIGFQVQGGVGLEAAVTPFQITTFFNWRSGELSLVYSIGGHYYIGTPSGLAGELSYGPVAVYGASENAALGGVDVYGTFTMAVDEFAEFGMSATGSRALNSDLTDWAIDPLSGRTIDTREINISFGGNLAANAVDIGVGCGLSWSRVLPIIDLY